MTWRSRAGARGRGRRRSGRPYHRERRENPPGSPGERDGRGPGRTAPGSPRAAPPRGERPPSILLTLSSSKPRTGTRLATLVSGILAVILNRRLSSSFNGSRRAIVAPPVCLGTRAVGWFPPPANRSPGQGRGPPDRSLAVRLRSWGMYLSMCLGQGLWYWNGQYLIYE